jgi:hypothetical protein
MADPAVDNGQQLLAEAGSQLVETVIPGTPVDHHRPAGSRRRRQWARGQQDRRGSTHSEILASIGWLLVTGHKLQFELISIKLFVVMPAISEGYA